MLRVFGAHKPKWGVIIKLRSHTIRAAARCAAVALTGVAMSGVGVAVANADAPSTAVNCAQTSVAGAFDVLQSNFPNETLKLDLAQAGSTVSGTFVGSTFSGIVSGTVSGNDLHVVIDYGGNVQGDYTATVSPGVLSDGYTFQVGVPSNNATFTATGTGGGCSAPMSKDQCKKGGFAAYGNPSAGIAMFKNQGDCVSYVASEGRSDAHS